MIGGIVKVNEYYTDISTDEYINDFMRTELPFIRAELDWKNFISNIAEEVNSEVIKKYEIKFKLNRIKDYAYSYDLRS